MIRYSERRLFELFRRNIIAILCFSLVLLLPGVPEWAFAQFHQFNPGQSDNGNGFGQQPPPPAFGNQLQQIPGNIGGAAYLTYQNPNLGFSILYPAGSQVTEHQIGVVMSFPGGSMTAIVLTNIDPSKLGQHMISVLGLTGQNIIQGDSTLAGYPSHYLIYTESNGVIANYSWIVVGDTGYIVAYFFDPHDPRGLIYNIVHTGNTSFQVSAQSPPAFGNQQQQPLQ